jgi:hypothetical protein
MGLSTYRTCKPSVPSLFFPSLLLHQHPDNSVAAGEALLASVYGALRNSSFWNETLLVVTYDEHGEEEGEGGSEGVRCLWGT